MLRPPARGLGALVGRWVGPAGRGGRAGGKGGGGGVGAMRADARRVAPPLKTLVPALVLLKSPAKVLRLVLVWLMEPPLMVTPLAEAKPPPATERPPLEKVLVLRPSR